MHKHQQRFEIVIEIDAHKNEKKREQNWLKHGNNFGDQVPKNRESS